VLWRVNSRNCSCKAESGMLWDLSQNPDLHGTDREAYTVRSKPGNPYQRRTSGSPELISPTHYTQSPCRIISKQSAC